MPIIITPDAGPTTITIDATESVFVEIDGERGAEISVSHECKLIAGDDGYRMVRPGAPIKAWGLCKLISTTWCETTATVAPLAEAEADLEPERIDDVVLEAGQSLDVVLARGERRRVHAIGSMVLEVSAGANVRIAQRGACLLAGLHRPVRISGLFTIESSNRDDVTVKISDVTTPKASESADETKGLTATRN